MDVDGYDMPDDLYYDKGFMWARVEGNIAVVGLIDFAQKLAGEISYLDMPFEGDEVGQGEEVGTVETGKWVGKLYAPVSGKIDSINEDLEDDPTQINSDPYSNGWIFKIEIGDKEELSNLMKIDEACDWLKGEIAKH